MKPILRELLTDFKAAAKLAYSESLYEALEQVHKMPDEVLPPSALVPLGRALAPFPAEELIPYLDDKDPAVRGIAAAALGARTILSNDVRIEVLDYITADPHAEVGAALGNALAEVGQRTAQPRLLEFARRWVTSPQQNTVMVGLKLLPLARPEPEELYDLLQPLYFVKEMDVHTVLVECLNTFASSPQPGMPAVILELLNDWVHRPDPNVWVITRVLSAHWAQGYTSEAVAVLNELVEETGVLRPIVRALSRLQEPSADNLPEDD